MLLLFTCHLQSTSESVVARASEDALHRETSSSVAVHQDSTRGVPY